MYKTNRIVTLVCMRYEEYHYYQCFLQLFTEMLHRHAQIMSQGRSSLKHFLMTGTFLMKGT